MIVDTRDGQVRGSERRRHRPLPRDPLRRGGSVRARHDRRERWDGVLEALDFGPIAPQDGGAQFQRRDLVQSEELPVAERVGAAAARRERRSTGHGVDPRRRASGRGRARARSTRPTALAQRGDAVVITINYRLGALGFLAHPSLADERRRWRRVRELGPPRPDRGAAVGARQRRCLRRRSRQRDDLRRVRGRGIGRLPRRVATDRPGCSTRRSCRAARRLACRWRPRPSSPSASRRRSASTASMRCVTSRSTRCSPGRTHCSTPGWCGSSRPTIDGHVLEQSGVRAMREGVGADIPMIIGTNVDEWKLWAPADPRSRDLDDDGLQRRVTRRLGEDRATPDHRGRARRPHRPRRAGQPERPLVRDRDRALLPPPVAARCRRAPHAPAGRRTCTCSRGARLRWAAGSVRAMVSRSPSCSATRATPSWLRSPGRVPTPTRCPTR